MKKNSPKLKNKRRNIENLRICHRLKESSPMREFQKFLRPAKNLMKAVIEK